MGEQFKFKVVIPRGESLTYTDEQQAIAGCQSDRIVVRALAGTGKTETVALRVQTQIARGMRADRIMVATFTKSARDQIEKRLRVAGIRGVRVATLHATALRLIRGSKLQFPLSDGSTFMRRALSLKNQSSSQRSVDFVFEAMRRSRTGGFDVKSESGFKASEIRDIVGLYSRLKEEARVIDFDDLFFFAADLVRPKFDEVIVDEAQDLTSAQAKFAAGLTCNRLVFIGDKNQAIFGWNGSDGSELDVDDAHELTLSMSFRSSPEILRVADRLIDAKFTTEQESGSVRFKQSIEQESAIVESVAAGANIVIGRTKRELHQWSRAVEDAGFTVDRSWKLDSERNKSAQVTMQTIHGSKGSEWSHVCLAGIGAEGFRGAGGIEDEDKRLMYVGVTRARRTLDLIFHDELAFGLGDGYNVDSA